MNSKIILSLIFFLQLININAQTKVATIFNNHMVLQQNTEVAIWGTDKPKTEVFVSGSWGAKSSIICDSNGKWKLFLMFCEVVSVN